MPGFDQVRPRSRILLQRFPGDARVRREERPSGWRTYREALAQKREHVSLTREPWQPENTPCTGWARLRLAAAPVRSFSRRIP